MHRTMGWWGWFQCETGFDAREDESKCRCARDVDESSRTIDVEEEEETTMMVVDDE